MNLRQTHESLGNLQAREGAPRRLAMNRRSLAHFLVHDEHSMSEHMNAWMNKRNKEMLGWHGYRTKGNRCCGALYLGHGERSDESPLSHNRDSLGLMARILRQPFPPRFKDSLCSNGGLSSRHLGTRFSIRVTYSFQLKHSFSR